MQTVITLLEAAAPDLLDRCLAVRQEVFTGKWESPPMWNRDSRDLSGPGSRHFLITRGRQGHRRRCAVCPRRTAPCGSSGSASGRTAGDRAPDARPSPLWKTASGRRGSRAVVLDAKCSARGFYEACGYEAVSGEFLEAGVPHVAMRRAL